MKAPDAAQYAGGVSEKLLYRAVRDGKLRAARVGSGRNLLFSDVFVDEWLERSVPRAAEPAGQIVQHTRGAA